MVVLGILGASIYGIFVTTEIALEAAGVSIIVRLHVSHLCREEKQFTTDKLMWYTKPEILVAGLLQACCSYQADIRICSHHLLWLDNDKSAAGLFPCNYQADISMCSHNLLWLDHDKSAAGLFSCNHQADIRMCSYRLLWLDGLMRTSLLQDCFLAIIKLISVCAHITCSSLMMTSLLQVVYVQA